MNAIFTSILAPSPVILPVLSTTFVCFSLLAIKKGKDFFLQSDSEISWKKTAHKSLGLGLLILGTLVGISGTIFTAGCIGVLLGFSVSPIGINNGLLSGLIVGSIAAVAVLVFALYDCQKLIKEAKQNETNQKEAIPVLHSDVLLAHETVYQENVEPQLNVSFNSRSSISLDPTPPNAFEMEEDFLDEYTNY